MKKTKAIILAAGQGTRMHSDQSKVLHEICGDALVNQVIRANYAAQIKDIAVIIGYQAEAVKNKLPSGISTFLQKEQFGTGHAVIQALPFIQDFEGNVLILVGDAPVVRPETLSALIESHEKGEYGVTVLTAWFEDPTGYGRIVKNGDELIRIVEQKDASEAEKAIHEINSGMYCFDAGSLRNALAKLTTNNAQHEYYLTDAIEIIRNNGKKVGTFITSDREDIAAVNSKAQLAEVRAIMQKRINEKWMAAGVTIVDPLTAYIDVDVEIDRDTVIEPGVMVSGKTLIGRNCRIGQNSKIISSTIKDNVNIQMSVVENCCIESGREIGPFAVMRGEK